MHNKKRLIANDLRRVLKSVSEIKNYFQLPPTARREVWRDGLFLHETDPGPDQAIDEAVAWLGRAQDSSTSQDGGVPRHFSYMSGWSSSYPETTGYTVPTMLNYAELRRDDSARNRAAKMLDWLVGIQFSNGAFQGGVVGSKPLTPVVFNTGQILLGLVSGVRMFGDKYYEPMSRAADFLVQMQDPDGCWRKHSTPFAIPGEKAYDTHVAWALLEAARVEPKKKYVEAALANVRWSLGLQQKNGWFDKCCLTDPTKPLTHTIGYVLRGIIEGYRFMKDVDLLRAAQKTANGLLTAVSPRGHLPGRLYRTWGDAVSSVCLTGNAQIASCYLLLYQYTDDTRYRDAGYALNEYVRRTISIDGRPETRGGIKGSFPIYGDYDPYKYSNAACKFFIDANILEQDVRRQENKLPT